MSQPPRPRIDARARGGAATSRVLPAALPCCVLVLLVLAVAWRSASEGATRPDPSGDPGPTTPTQVRRFGDLRLRVPSGWVTLDRAAGHVTWGAPDRSHTVTLASTESSVLPLPGVVSAVSAESARAMPGTRPEGRPTTIEVPGPAARGDAAVLARFRVEDAAGDLEVAQAWRRDARAGIDVVATWTSSDGRWPVDPASGIPLPTATG